MRFKNGEELSEKEMLLLRGMSPEYSLRSFEIWDNIKHLFKDHQHAAKVGFGWDDRKKLLDGLVDKGFVAIYKKKKSNTAGYTQYNSPEYYYLSEKAVRLLEPSCPEAKV